MLRRVVEIKQYGGGNVEIDTELKLECGHSRWFIGGNDDWLGSPTVGEHLNCPQCDKEGKRVRQVQEEGSGAAENSRVN